MTALVCSASSDRVAAVDCIASHTWRRVGSVRQSSATPSITWSVPDCQCLDVGTAAAASCSSAARASVSTRDELGDEGVLVGEELVDRTDRHSGGVGHALRG